MVDKLCWLLTGLLMGGLVSYCSPQHHQLAPEVGHSMPTGSPESVMEIPELFFNPMYQENAQDLQWIKVLVLALNTGRVTLEQAIAYIGEDKGIDPWDSTCHLVDPRSLYIKSARVYPLMHIDVPVAVDIEFESDSKPKLSSLQDLLGDFRPIIRSSDDFQSGNKVGIFYRPENAPMTARVFAELSISNEELVVKLRVDAEKFRE